MKKVNNYYVDDNNNKWNNEFYTEEQAIKNSKSLTKCFNCVNCSDCHSCSYCHSCSDCSDFKENPQRYITPKIGSRKSQTTFYPIILN